MSLSVKLKELRLKKKESLQDVADAVGVSKTHIWELERGTSSNPSMDLLTRLADHFQTTVRTLAGEDPEEGADENLMRMFRQASSLGEREREVLDDMIQSLLKQRAKAKKDAPD